MSSQLLFYRERAAQAASDAAEAKLDNVRDRCLRAEEAWLGMAARVERSERMRADAAAHKAGPAVTVLLIPDADESLSEA